MPIRELSWHQEFLDLMHRGLPLPEFFEAADRALSSVVPFDASCWLGLDPSTLLPTSHFTREVGSDHLLRIAAIEFLDDDVNKFAELARAATPVGRLSRATLGEPTRSKRFREILAPSGFGSGDELRAVFREGSIAWGCVAIHRHDGPFSTHEAEVVAELGGAYIGEGIHRAMLTTALQTGSVGEAPGLILLGPDDQIEHVSTAAAEVIADLVDSTSGSAGLPLLVTALAARVRGGQHATEPATARLPGTDGGWLALYGSALDGRATGRVAVMMVPERSSAVPRALAESYGLTPRESEVFASVLQGRSTREIAADLCVTEYTVQDHLKRVFDKTEVRSRRELVAKVFAEQYAPRLARGHQ